MSALTRWERVAYAVSVVLGLLALVLLPLVRVVDPRLAVAFNEAHHTSLGLTEFILRWSSEPATLDTTADPWGRPYRWRPKLLYSVGPDGVDQQGQGDDISRDDARAHPLRTWAPHDAIAAPAATLAVVGTALALWTFVTHWTLRAARRRPLVEALRAVFIAAGPVALGIVWIVGIHRLDQGVAGSGASDLLQLRPSIAIALTWALFCYLPALAWRLSRPQPEAPLT